MGSRKSESRTSDVLPLLVCFVCFLGVLGTGCGQESSRVARPNRPASQLLDSSDLVVEEGRVENRVINTRFIDEDKLFAALSVEPREFDADPVAGVVNHHSLAADLQARFFVSLRQARPDIKTFVVISPDHFSSGSGITCHEYGYATAFGKVEIDKSLVGDLAGNGCDLLSGEKFDNEHGVGVLMPYIKYFFPKAKIVPIFVHIDYPIDRAAAFGERLAGLLPPDAFVIVSADMSHYLNDEQARQNDEQTLSWLVNNDWEQLTRVTDAYTDSAVSFAILSGLFEDEEADFEMLDHAVSTDYGADPMNTTSYITGFFVANTEH